MPLPALPRRTATPPDVLAEFRAGRGGPTPVLTASDEPGHVAVSFLAHEPDAAVRLLLHLSGHTDARRRDVRPWLLDAEPDGLRHLTVHLPDDVLASYRLVHLADLADDAGATREGWLRVHEAGRPDPGNPATMHRPMGSRASLLAGPRAPRHHAWPLVEPSGPASTDASVAPGGRADHSHAPDGAVSDDHAPDGSAQDGVVRRVVLAGTWDGPADGPGGYRNPGGDVGGRELWYLPPVSGEPTTLLVLLDGDQWAGGLDLVRGHRRHALPGLAVVAVSSVGAAARAAQLRRPDIVGDLLAQKVLPWVSEQAARAFGPDDVVVAGQSYGGLAAAGVVVTRPDLARRAVVQSASLHIEATGEGLPPRGQVGSLVREVRALAPDALAGARIVVQVGALEPDMHAASDAFVAAARAAGAAVDASVWPGGHDYAWWRPGLATALDALVGGAVATRG